MARLLASAVMSTSSEIASLAELHALYGEPVPTAITKEVSQITSRQRDFIEASPFAILATAGPEGLDCSPRGDPAGFARVPDEHTVLMPDRRGNNRLDSLRNIVRDGRIGVLFLIPGITMTLRINGCARLLTDDGLRASFAMGDKLPATVIEITAETIYTQCPKALVRSKIWDPETFLSPTDVPTSGQIMEQITNGEIDGEAYDAAYPERLRSTIY